MQEACGDSSCNNKSDKKTPEFERGKKMIKKFEYFCWRYCNVQSTISPSTSLSRMLCDPTLTGRGSFTLTVEANVSKKLRYSDETSPLLDAIINMQNSESPASHPPNCGCSNLPKSPPNLSQSPPSPTSPSLLQLFLWQPANSIVLSW